MRAHVRAIRIEQDHLAAILAAIQREVLAEEAHALRLVGDLGGLANHEPAAWKRELTKLVVFRAGHEWRRSEEHTSELQSLMRISYAVFCLNKKHKYNKITNSQ